MLILSEKMSSKCLQRLSTFAKWPMPSDHDASTGSASGIMNFTSKAAGAYFERSAECVDDEVLCQSCGVQFCDWSNNSHGSDCELYDSPAAVHRIISPKCPALNPQNEDVMTEESLRDGQNLSSLIDNPYAKYLPSRFQACLNTPEQPAYTRRIQRAARVQRELFPEEPDSDQQQQQDQEIALDPGDEIPQSTSALNLEPLLCVLDQTPITHPYKPKSGSYDHLFASHRLQTFPQPLSCSRYQTWAEEGFVFRGEQQDVMCVYCGTVLVLNGHQPGVVHRKACPACPFVMGFDVGNISIQQEKCVRLKYFKQQAAKKQIEIDVKYVQYHDEEERWGTFQGWPKMCAKMFPASVMVSAGFFYSGCSDKVVCYSCGVELYDWSEEADVWQTHAAVSPTCLHIINCKGQHFITQAANLQVLAEVKYPKGSERGGVGSSGGVVGEEPGCPILDMTAIKAALACGYTLLQIQHAIVKFFCQTSRYPNEAILKASLKASDENHITICKQQQLVLQKDTWLQQQGVQLQQQGVQLQQQGVQLQQKDTQLQQKDTQLQQKDTQLQQKDTQLQENEQTVQTLQHSNARLNDQLSVQEEQLSVQEEQLSVQEEQLRWQDEQIQSLMQQVQRLRADLPRPVPPPPPHGDGANDEASRQSLVCKICMSDKPRMIFLPCGHLFSCAECTSRLPDKRCPVCRQDISEVLPAFVA